MIQPIDDLSWFFWDSPSELGVKAQQYSENYNPMQYDPVAATLVPGWISYPTPTKKQVNAATRQKYIYKVFKKLSPNHRRAISICYEPGATKAPQLDSEYGLAAPLVQLCQESIRKDLEEYVALLPEAKQHLKKSREIGKKEDIDDAVAYLARVKAKVKALQNDLDNAAEDALRLLKDAHHEYIFKRKNHTM